MCENNLIRTTPLLRIVLAWTKRTIPFEGMLVMRENGRDKIWEVYIGFSVSFLLWESIPFETKTLSGVVTSFVPSWLRESMGMGNM